MGVATATGTVKTGGAAGASKATVAPRAFRIAVQSVDEIDYDETRTLLSSTQDMSVLQVPPAGFLRGLWILVEATTAGNSAATAYKEDGPFNVLDSVTFEDVSNAPILGPFNGYDLYLINKWGGYAYIDDPKQSPVYSATTGSGATGGSFAFVLFIPLELCPRDALGSLPNKSGTSMFKLRMRLAVPGTIYSTTPTNAASVRVRVQQENWWDPESTDLKGRPQAQNPPAVQTTQYWSAQESNVSAGTMRLSAERVGYPIRNIIMVLRDSNGSRSVGETDWPDPFRLKLEANIVVDRLKKVWQHKLARDYGYIAGIGDTVNFKDNGVYVLPFCLDFAFKPGWETRRGYLLTASAARLELGGTIGGSGIHVMRILTNDVAPANGDDAAFTV